MAFGYENFMGTAWAAQVLTNLQENCFLTDFCTKEYEGEVKRNGQIYINGIVRPTIGTYTGAEINDPESVDDFRRVLKIDQAKYFNVFVDSVAKAQMKPDLMKDITREAGQELAVHADKYIATVIAVGETVDGTEAEKLTPATIATADDVQITVDDAITALYENNVSQNTELEVVLSPKFYQLFRSKMDTLFTDNIALLRRGYVGRYNNALIKMSNNLDTTTTEGFTSCFARTRRAVAWAEQIDEVEAYRPEKFFGDAVKGLHLYGAAIVRPEELVIMPMKVSA